VAKESKRGQREPRKPKLAKAKPASAPPPLAARRGPQSANGDGRLK